MADTYSLLLAEINRVVDSAYPTQLKSLRDILCSKCTVADINTCIQARLCRIDDLVCLLVPHGLRQWPYVLDIITRLSCNVIVRDALLKREPTLLSDLVAQTLKTDHGRTKYRTAVVSMLAHPLPEHVTLPSAVQLLFLRLVDQAAESPSADTITRVYTLLQGTSTLLLGLLSNESLLRFEEQIMSILFNSSRRSSHDGDQLLTLRCLAIMKLVTTAADSQLMLTNSFYQTQELLASTQPTSPKWNAAEMRKFFTSSSSTPKTITLLVLQSMWACQSSSHSFDERKEALRIVNDLMAAIPAELRDQWCASNTAVVQRLQHKALSCEAGCSLQLQAFGVVAQLCKPVFLQMAVVEGIRQAISQPEILTQASAQEIEASWSHCMAAVLDLHTAEALIHRLLSYLVEADACEIVKSSIALLHIVRQLAAMAGEHQEVTEAAMIVLSTTKTLQQLQELTQRMKTEAGSPTTSTTVCSIVWQNARRQVCLELSNFLLTSALGSQLTEHTLSGCTGPLLLQLHATSARSDTRCRHTRPKHQQVHSPLIFVEEKSTPSDSHPDWRETLEAHLASEAQANHSVLSRLFAQACQDLEARCESVEEPLRDEQSKRAALQEQYDQLNEAYATLEAQTIERQLHCDSLEVERDQFLQDVDLAREEAEGLLHRISELERNLRNSKDDGEVRIAELQKARNTADLEHAAAIAKKAEELEDLEDRVKAINISLTGKTNDLDKLQVALHDSRVAKDDLQSDVDRLKRDLEEKSAEVNALQNTARDNTAHLSKLDLELQTAKEDFAKAEQAHEHSLQQVQEHHKQIREAANASHNELMDRLAAEQGEAIANFERQLAVLREESEQVAEQQATELLRREEEARDAEQQIDRLHLKCKQKDQQIAEANAMRTNLMAAMGIGPGMNLPTQASLPHRTRTSSGRTQYEHDSQPGPSPPTPASAGGMESQVLDGRASFVSNGSSGHSRSGPTPKRARPRKSFKAPSPAKPRSAILARAARASTGGRSTSKRQPLLSMSVNRTPEKTAPKTPSKYAQNDARDGYDESTLDENELIIHTPDGKLDVDLSGMLLDDTQE